MVGLRAKGAYEEFRSLPTAQVAVSVALVLPLPPPTDPAATKEFQLTSSAGTATFATQTLPTETEPLPVSTDAL